MEPNLKQFKHLSLLMLLIGLLMINHVLAVQAQATYRVGVNEGDVYIWEVKELRKHEFSKVFGFEPFFSVGDQIRMKIEQIIESTDGGYTIVAEFWDYGTDWNEKGEIKYYSVPSSPSEYEDNLFILTPANKFLEEAMKSLPNSYSLDDTTITKLSVNFTKVLEYHSKGILYSETYINDDGIVMVKVEGTFRIVPLGYSYIIFMLLSIVIVIMKIRKSNLINIKKS
ncbi:MAG: hypothetical protein ACTSU4_04995 [Promethearchaeota archaeon]